MLDKMETLKLQVKSEIRTAKEKLVKFKADLEKNPGYAMQWADSAFHAAAVLEIYTELDKGLQSPEFDLKDYQQSLFRWLNGSFGTSTSASSNVYSTEKHRVIVELYQFFVLHVKAV